MKVPTRRSVAIAAVAALAGATIGVASAEAIPPPGGNGKPDYPAPVATSCTATLETATEMFMPVKYRTAVTCKTINANEKVRAVLVQKFGESQYGPWFMSTGGATHYTEWAYTQHKNGQDGMPDEFGATSAAFEVAKR